MEDEGCKENFDIDVEFQKENCIEWKNLSNFLDSSNVVTSSGDKKTNITNIGLAKRSYDIPDVLKDRFFTLLERCRLKNLHLNFQEKQSNSEYDCSGIMIDFDYYQSDNIPKINKEHLDDLVKSIARIIKNYINYKDHVVNNKFKFKIFIIKKKEILKVNPIKYPRIAHLYKDGFHILIPEIQVNKTFKRFLINKLQPQVETIFNNIEHPHGIDKLLDVQSANNPVHFFGNCKPGGIAYELHKMTEIIFNEIYSEIDTNSQSGRDIIESEYNLTYELSLATYLKTIDDKPTWLVKRPYTYNNEVDLYMSDIQEDKQSEEQMMELLQYNNNKAYELKSYIDLLDDSYSSEYSKWLTIVFGIANTARSSGTNYEDFKFIARYFSKKCPEKFDENVFETLWKKAIESYHTNPVTIGTIKYYAKESNKEKYEELINNQVYNHIYREIYKNMGIIPDGIAAAFCQKLVGDLFISHFPSHDTPNVCYWYKFIVPDSNGYVTKDERYHIYRWKKFHEPMTLKPTFNNIMNIYERVKSDLYRKRNNEQDQNKLKKLTIIIDNIDRSKKSLNTNNYVSSVLKGARTEFYDGTFYEELDKDKYVIGVGNGVLVFGNSVQLIQGIHDYRVSRSTKVNYYKFDANNENIKILLNAFSEIFPEKDVCEYMLFHASTGLDACYSCGILTMLVGGGQNGKTFYAKMVSETLGKDYSVNIKSSLLTSPPEKSEAPNPALMQLMDKRYGFADEFGSNTTLNIERLKTINNPSSQSGRRLRQDEVTFKNTLNLICLSNYDFVIDTTDHGTWRRIYYYRNKVKFCKNPSGEFERKENSNFVNKYPDDPKMKEAMLSILVHYRTRLFNEYNDNLSDVPVPTIMKETNQFRNRQDSLNRYISMNLFVSEGIKANIEEVARHCLNWYKTSGLTKKITVDDIMSQLENSAISSSLRFDDNGITKSFIGYRLKGDFNDKPNADKGEHYIGQVVQVARDIPVKQEKINEYEIVSNDISSEI